MIRLPVISAQSHAADQPEAGRHQPHTALIDALHLTVLTVFAVAQPVFDRLGERPAFLSDSGVGRRAVLLLTVTFALLVPAGVSLFVELVSRLAPRARRQIHLVAVFALAVVIALPVVKRLEFLLPPPVLFVAALLAATAASWSYAAFRAARSLVTAAAPAIVVFPMLFLFYSPVSTLFLAPQMIRATRGKPAPVVVLVFDELRGTSLVDEKNEIDAGRFPNFAELARHSTWFRNATTVHPETAFAVPALLSGKYPATTWVPGPKDLPQNMFSVLESTGDYEMAIFEPVSHLATLRVETESRPKPSVLSQAASILPTLARVFLVHLMPSELQKDLPEIPRLWFGMGALREVDRTARRGVFRYLWGQDRREQFEHFLDCLEDSPTPGLHFMHVLLPHVPWCYLPSGQRYLAESNRWELLDFNTNNPIADFWGTDELFVTQSQQRQLLQLQYVDRLIGQLIARLRETGIFDKCLLVVTADHGICFKIGESRRSISPGNLADILPIPLFFKKPGQTSGEVSDRNVESIDLLPTMTDVLGIEMNLPVDGRSMFDVNNPERPHKTLCASFGQNFYVPQMSLPASIASASTAAGEIRARFGPSGDSGALFRIGPHPELIGRSAASLPLAGDDQCDIELTRSGTFYSTDRQAIVPCYIEGRVLSPNDRPLQIAVAVNGTIRAVTRTYLVDGFRDQWSAMIPELAYREGENEVDYYLVTGQGSDLRLARCAVRR